jgi:hypothetical protein
MRGIYDLTKGADVIRHDFISVILRFKGWSHAYDARDDRSGTWWQAAHGGT